MTLSRVALRTKSTNQRRPWFIFTGVVLVVAGAVLLPAHADAPMLQNLALVDHPALSVRPALCQGAWNRGVGGFGETLAQTTLQLRGFRVYKPQNSSGQGIDRIAVKRGAEGELIDVKLCEVKTGQFYLPGLGRTSNGMQMSRTWLAKAFTEMRNSGDPELKQLAAEIMRFYKAKSLPIENLGEVWKVNVSQDRIIGFRPGTGETLFDMRITSLLRDLEARASGRARAWAIRHQVEFDGIRTARMPRVSGASTTGEVLSAETLIPGTRFCGTVKLSKEIPKRAKWKARARTVGKWAGRAGMAVVLATESYLVVEYLRGGMNTREFTQSQAAMGGGLGGALAGAAIGTAIAGPVGAVIGGTVMGLAGGYAGEQLVAWRYEIRDEAQRHNYEEAVYRFYGVER